LESAVPELYGGSCHSHESGVQARRNSLPIQRARLLDASAIVEQPGVTATPWRTALAAVIHGATALARHAVHPGFDPLAAKQRWRRH
jgi:hypothetical protein